MGVELFVELTASAASPHEITTVMLWSAADDPALLDVRVFETAADLRAWLKSVGAHHGRQNVTVRWTSSLKAHKAVCSLIAVCLGVAVPNE